jgi:hypothetical protein
MKEAFWGILIVMLGLLGIVIVNIFQNVTVGNDRTYYQLKESAEAAAYDAIDLAYYRLNGDLRMVEDKFVENFTRRFAQNIGNNGNYNITIQEITGNPPRISIKISTGITSLQGDDFGIVNRIDGILETKYKIGEITNFLGITEEEWLARINANGEKDNACNVTTYGSEELECIPGDLEFLSWGPEDIPETVCDAGVFETEKRNANYRVCECGKWKNESAEVTAIPKKNGSEYIYNWVFKKTGEIRNINEIATTRAYVEKCTTAIQIYVPEDLRIKEPSTDNSKYIICPAEGIRIPQGIPTYLHINYTPSDSSNRRIDWSIPKDDKTITFWVNNPLTEKGYSKAEITGQEIGTTTLTATSTNGKIATCKIVVWDGNVDEVKCVDDTLTKGDKKIISTKYSPKNSTKINFTYTSSNTSILTISGNTMTAKAKGTSTITVTAPNGKTGTCVIMVNNAPGGGGGGTSTGGTCTGTVPDYIRTDLECSKWTTQCYDSYQPGTTGRLVGGTIKFCKDVCTGGWVPKKKYKDTSKTGTTIIEESSSYNSSTGRCTDTTTTYCLIYNNEGTSFKRNTKTTTVSRFCGFET